MDSRVEKLAAQWHGANSHPVSVKHYQKQATSWIAKFEDSGLVVIDPGTIAPHVNRVAEFLRQWQIPRNKSDEIYGVRHDIDGDVANLTVTDLTAVLSALQGGA